MLAGAGCDHSSKGAPNTKGEAAAGQQPVTVTVVSPQRASIRRTIRQPGTIQAFEQTPIFAKIAGYVQKWHVDIGDQVRQGDLLAELSVPELVEELKLKEEVVKQARGAYEVARARVATAAALVEEARAGLQRAAANQQRWQLEYDRIAKLIGVIDEQTKIEHWRQLQSAVATGKEAEAKVESARAALQEGEAVQNKAQVDIGAAEADRGRVAALLGYARLTAPFDGVVTRRTINTGDFVQAPTSGKGEPLFVVERRDMMRIFVAVPETDAVWVSKGAAARVRVQALQRQEFVSEVVRTSYALDRTARTLLAEIDLSNPQDRLRPGMYASANITVEHPNVLTLPVSAVVTQGDVLQGYQTYCCLVEDGKVRRCLIEFGARDGQRVEVVKKQAKSARSGEPGVWEDFTEADQVILNNPGALSDGQAVVVGTKP
jgi:RND family efflux transporter MFP subunit